MNKRIHIFIITLVSFFCLCTTLLAQQSNTDSLTILLRSSTDKEKITILSNQANTLRYTNPNQAVEFANQAIEVAIKLKDADALARNYQLVARLYFQSGEFAKSKEYYIQSLDYFEQIKDEKGKADVKSALAGIHYAQGNLPAAVEGYLEVLRFYEQTNDKVGLLNTLSSLGNIYTRQNNFIKAIEYNLRAIKIYEQSTDKLRTLVGYDNIGNIFVRQGNYKKAKEYFTKSLKLYTEINNKAGIAYTYNQLGNIESKQDHNEAAIHLYKKSLSISKVLKTQPLTVSNLNNLGESYLKIRQYDNAVSSYKEAITIAKKVGLKIELDIAYQGLANIYTITNELGRAQTFASLSNEMKDSLFNDSVVKQLADVQLRYESEKKQTQIERLSKEQAIKDAELLRERQIRNVFIGALAILLAVFVVLIYYFIQNKQITKNLEKQKSELQQKNKDILEQTEKLNQLNIVKDRFFSIISHDLRNNLTTMKLYFDLISNPEYQKSDNTEITKNISSSVENTIDLLENLLIWASAQIKGVPMHIQKLNMHSLAEENINLLIGGASQKNIELRNELAEDITAMGDMDMIKLVLRNLIANAIKFTSENGLIRVTAKVQNAKCRISVIDNGVGISKAAIAQLFDQHMNPTTKGTGNEKGTGLGLILCRDFIENNNGSIWVESEEGRGSTFTFELPLA